MIAYFTTTRSLTQIIPRAKRQGLAILPKTFDNFKDYHFSPKKFDNSEIRHNAVEVGLVSVELGLPKIARDFENI